MPRDGLIQRFEFDQIEYGGENLLFNNGHRRMRFDERGLDETCAQFLASKNDLAALVSDAIERGTHGFYGPAIDERAHKSGFVERVTDRNLGVGGFQLFGHRPGDVAMKKQAPDAGAALAGGADCAEQHGPQREIEIGVVHHDNAVVAAEFEQRASEPAADGLGDDAAHAARAGSADKRKAGVFQQALSHGGILANDEAEDAAPAMALEYAVANFLHCNRGQGGFQRWLPENTIAAYRSQQGIPGPDCEREVESRNNADDSERMPLLEHAVLGPLARHSEAVELSRQADGKIGDVDHLLDFAFSLSQDFAHFERHERSEVVFEMPQLVADLAHDLAPLGRRDQTPAREELNGVGNDAVIILSGSQTNLG